MKKFLSYLWPDTKRFHSDVNGTLEVTYIDGEKILDTENANYSYGSLQKILEFGVKKVDLDSVGNILLLGLGGGSIIQSLRKKFKYQKDIVAVDIDPKIIQIAKEEFGVAEAANQKIVQQDALVYVRESQEKFQLVIIDLFIDTEVPPVFFEKEFCRNVGKMIDTNGSVIFNVGIKLIKETKKSKSVISHFGKEFHFQIYPNVKGSNFLLIGKKE